LFGRLAEFVGGRALWWGRDEEIPPVIPIRHGWQNQTDKLVPGPERRGNIVHTEAGTVFCVGITSRPTVKHQMASVEYEADRGTLQWRCPGRHEGWECPLAAKGDAGKAYGLTVRVKRETDLRRFCPIPQATG